MDGQNMQKPFEICIESERYPSKGLDHWKTDKASHKRFFAKKYAWLIVTLLAAVILSFGVLLSSELGYVAPKMLQKATYPFAPISTQALDTDAGLVLLDVQSGHAAASLHVSGPGVYVLSVTKGSPANAAGLHPGDCILQLNGADVKDATAFLTFLNDLRSGETAMIVLRRASDQLTISYKAGYTGAQI